MSGDWPWSKQEVLRRLDCAIWFLWRQMWVRPSKAAFIKAPFKNRARALQKMQTLNWDTVSGQAKPVDHDCLFSGQRDRSQINSWLLDFISSIYSYFTGRNRRFGECSQSKAPPTARAWELAALPLKSVLPSGLVEWVEWGLKGKHKEEILSTIIISPSSTGSDCLVQNSSSVSLNLPAHQQWHN